jgi:hypothetical protein
MVVRRPDRLQAVEADTSFPEGTRARTAEHQPLHVVAVDAGTTSIEPSVADSLRA